MKKASRIKSCSVITMIVFFCGCRAIIRTQTDPFDESFFEKTRLIMTEEEIKTYRSLEGEEQKKEFMDEFWRIRDPYPETEVNENKIEFERRVLFANEWFDKYRRRRNDFDHKSARGWQTSKGRIYIIFGPPESINYGNGWGPMKKFPPQDAIYESWSYPQHELTISFVRQRMEVKMETIPERGPEEGEDEEKGKVPSTYVDKIVGSGGWGMIPEFKIIDAMEVAKRRWISPQYRGDIDGGIRFKARYVKDRIRIRIPSDKVVYVDADGILNVYLQINIVVYRGDEVIDELDEDRVLNFAEEQVLELEEIEIEVPFSPKESGEYGFDITVTDLKSEVLAKFRQFIKQHF